MNKDFSMHAEKSLNSIPPVAEVEEDRKGEHPGTRKMGEAKFINIKRLGPDPDQPRKTFPKESLEELTESFREIGVLNPLIVEFVEDEDFYRIIDGERRYRAGLMAGLPELPCIEREVSGDRRLLEQLEINLLREDVPWLEVAEAFRILIEKFDYKQVDLARRFNRHKSGISELYSVSKLDESVKKRVSEVVTVVPKEALVAASRKQSPEEQMQIVEMTLGGKRTKKIREAIRGEKKDDGGVTEGREEALGDTEAVGLEEPLASEKKPIEKKDAGKFTEFRWEPEDKEFTLVIAFAQPQLEKKKNIIVEEALGQAYKHVTNVIYRGQLHSEN